MALLTISKESTPTEAGNSALTSSKLHRLAGSFWIVRVPTPHYLIFFAYTARAEIWRLACEGRKVTASANFGGKQSRQIGPCFINKIAF